MVTPSEEKDDGKDYVQGPLGEPVKVPCCNHHCRCRRRIMIVMRSSINLQLLQMLVIEDAYADS
eukprot:19430-Eustigmatos_ZCMA.PRE.1